MVRIVEAVLRRAAGPLDKVNGLLEASVDTVAGAIETIPTSVLALVVGLVVWRGRHIGRALAAVAAVHVMLWAASHDVIRTVLAGVFAATVGVPLALLVLAAVRWVVRRRGTTWRPSVPAPPLVLVGAALVLMVVPYGRGDSGTPWVLAAMPITAVVFLATHDGQGRIGPAVKILRDGVASGVAAALLVGSVTLDGLGGLVRHAATTSQIDVTATVAAAVLGVLVLLWLVLAGQRPTARTDEAVTEQAAPVGTSAR